MKAIGSIVVLKHLMAARAGPCSLVIKILQDLIYYHAASH